MACGGLKKAYLEVASQLRSRRAPASSALAAAAVVEGVNDELDIGILKHVVAVPAHFVGDDAIRLAVETPHGDICRAAYAATLGFFREHVPGGSTKLQRAVPAMVVVPQSSGDLLVAHPRPTPQKPVMTPT